MRGPNCRRSEFVASGEHPGGDEVPLQYAGRDATEFWLDTHGHLLDEIMEDVESGEGDNTFLEVLPKRIGRTDGTTPTEAQVYARRFEQNWAGNIDWGAAHGNSFEVAEPESLEELCEVVKNASAARVLGRGHSFVPAAM